MELFALSSWELRESGHKSSSIRFNNGFEVIKKPF